MHNVSPVIQAAAKTTFVTPKLERIINENRVLTES